MHTSDFKVHAGRTQRTSEPSPSLPCGTVHFYHMPATFLGSKQGNENSPLMQENRSHSLTVSFTRPGVWFTSLSPPRPWRKLLSLSPHSGRNQGLGVVESDPLLSVGSGGHDGRHQRGTGPSVTCLGGGGGLKQENSWDADDF